MSHSNDNSSDQKKPSKKPEAIHKPNRPNPPPPSGKVDLGEKPDNGTLKYKE